MSDKEKRGIYNVSFNEKKATPIYKDIEIVENTIIETIAMYVRGYHNPNKDKGRGAEHIKIHLEQGSEGEITLEELLNLGHSLRKYLKRFEEPFIDKKGGKVFEWENDNSIRFRAVVARMGGGTDLPSHTHSNDYIITFYSDRNFKDKMEFKNPNVKEYYEVSQRKKEVVERYKNKIKEQEENIVKNEKAIQRYEAFSNQKMVKHFKEAQKNDMAKLEALKRDLEKELSNINNEIAHSKIILNKGFERSEVAGACDILESGGEVSKPSHLQIKNTANQDFGKNPTNIIPQTNENKDNTKQKSPFFSKMKNSLCKVKEGLNIGKEKINNDEGYSNSETLKNLDKDTKDDENEQDKNSNTQNSNKTLRKRK